MKTIYCAKSKIYIKFKNPEIYLFHETLFLLFAVSVAMSIK